VPFGPPVVDTALDADEDESMPPQRTNGRRVERTPVGSDFETPTHVSGPLVVPPGHAPFRPEVRGELGPLIDALHELFVQDRTIASQGANARCGICYLHYPLIELEYREAEGFYVCPACKAALGGLRIPMVRRQQR
jgi:hypothetical protein